MVTFGQYTSMVHLSMNEYRNSKSHLDGDVELVGDDDPLPVPLPQGHIMPAQPNG